MSATTTPVLDEVLGEELRLPFYLTGAEVRGGWRERFPELAESLAIPYPIFCKDEDRVVLHGYPVLLSAGMARLQHEIDGLIGLEIEYRCAPVTERESEKRRLMSRRTRYTKSLTAIIENTLINDYGRGLFEVFLLFHSADIARAVGRIPSRMQRRGSDLKSMPVDRVVLSITGTFGEVLHNASSAAFESLRKMTHLQWTTGMPPLLSVLCEDQLLLMETRIPHDIATVAPWVRARLGVDANELKAACTRSASKLLEVVNSRPELGDLMSMISGVNVRDVGWRALLEPRLLDVVEAAGLAISLEIPIARLEILRDLGHRLKRYELLAALRRRVLRMEKQGTEMVMIGASGPTAIAPTTRPFDFAAPGVVSSAVERFGLIYDLTNFTQTLEEVRKKGRAEEERALRLMYVFQGHLEAIRQRRRLKFEKFLGDGAFYSARRGLRVLAAGCEIQCLYDDLRRSGFPFDLGIRIAMNFGSYQLLPMWTHEPGVPRFEFFGHGIVELARLSTGKSTREIEQIAEFLVYAGYDPGEVDGFLEPLMMARGRGGIDEKVRRYSATLDARGELVNEGIVLTVPFLAEIEPQLADRDFWAVESDGFRWLVFELDPCRGKTLYVGLRHMGVARLKGLQPCELIEAAVWREVPNAAKAIRIREPLLGIMRRLATKEETSQDAEDEVEIAEDLVVITFTEKSGRRHWIFGEYRPADDVLLHGIHVPIKADGLDEDVVEVWLLKNRFGLARIYESLRRETSGLSTPLAPLRRKHNYTACFLAAPHRSPE